MNISIAARIRWALVGLAVGLCLVFSMLTFLLVYIVEDQVFVNQLRLEADAFERTMQNAAEEGGRNPSLPDSQRNSQRAENGSENTANSWQQANRQMRLFTNAEALPPDFKNLATDQDGVYEVFDGTHAAFLLAGRLPNSQHRYFILYDVSEMLAVRKNRIVFFLVIALLSVLMVVLAVFVATSLAKITLSPLRSITDRLRNDKSFELPENFSQDFSGDEVGVLAKELEAAMRNVKAAADREFEFNRGVSHELRSPIQVAQNATELLLAQSLSEKNPVLERLRRSISEMQQISETFLWLASNRQLAKDETSDLTVIQEVLANHRDKYPQHKVTLAVNESDICSLTFQMPKQVLSLVLNNLLKNAVDHSNSHEARCNVSKGLIEVRNPFTPERNETSRGYGVGLSIVDRICERFAWRLDVIGSGEQEMVVQLSDVKSI